MSEFLKCLIYKQYKFTERIVYNFGQVTQLFWDLVSIHIYKIRLH